MKNLKFVFVFLISLIFNTISFGQLLAPSLDPNWKLNTLKSDEFNGTSLDPAKWIPTGCCNLGYGLNTNYISESNGSLNLAANWIGQSIFSSAIVSVNTYKYGYYEMRAKLPGYLNPANNLPCNHGFWTAFWVANHTQIDIPYCVTSHEEIDIVEPNGTSFNGENDGQTNEVGSIMWDHSCNVIKYGKSIIHNLPPLYDNYHKFGAEFLADRIIYYFDDVPFNVVYDQPEYPTHNMNVFFGNQLAFHIQSANLNNNPSGEFNNNTTWPKIFEVEYFHFYELKKDCGTDVIINNNTDLSNYVFSVKRNITIGNGSGIVSLNPGGNTTFRFTDELTINGDFTAPLNSELNIIPTPCN